MIPIAYYPPLMARLAQLLGRALPHHVTWGISTHTSQCSLTSTRNRYRVPLFLLTFVPTDFVRSGGFMLHRHRGFSGRDHTLAMRCSTSGSGAGGGLRVCNS